MQCCLFLSSFFHQPPRPPPCSARTGFRSRFVSFRSLPLLPFIPFPTNHTHTPQGSPSLCILDTAIIPLPSFILLLSLPLLFFLRTTNQNAKPQAPLRWVHIAYALLVLSALGMSVLELGRLGAEGMGVGLLPVGSIALGAVLGVLWRERHSRTRDLSIVSHFFMFGCSQPPSSP